MTHSGLIDTVDAWTAQAVVASAYLAGLYRALDDGRQAALAMQAQGHCEERVRRLGLQAPIAQLEAQYTANHPDGTDGEQRAWELLLQAQAGLVAFHGLVDDHQQSASIRGQRTAANKALQKALRGYRSAFPDEVTQPGIARAIEIAANRYSASFTLEVEGATEEERTELRREFSGIPSRL